MLDNIRAQHELRLMPNTCRVITIGTTSTNMGMGQTIQTGTDTPSGTLACRIRQLSGQELLQAQSASLDVDYKIAVPYGTAVTAAQDLTCVESGQRFRIENVGSESYQFELQLLCKQVSQ